MRLPSRCLGAAACVAVLVACGLSAGRSQAGGLPLPAFLQRKCHPTPVEALAQGIDDVEDALNEMGTIVAKRPDVWGESRLTKHRQEFEKQLEKKLDDFQLLLNASVRRSDQAFLANALALQAATQGGSPTGAPTGGVGSLIETPKVSVETTTNEKGETTTTANSSTGTLYRTPLGGLPRARIHTGGELGFASDKIGIEPTIYLDQLKRYIDHLHEIRRLNEGGDTADSPGYSLNLVRIPVSVLPGGNTRKGRGGEITVTATAHVTPELLPTTFRDLVVQDLLDQLSLPVRKLVDFVEEAEKLRAEIERASSEYATGAERVQMAEMSLQVAEADLTRNTDRQAQLTIHVTQLKEALKKPISSVATEEIADALVKIIQLHPVFAGWLAKALPPGADIALRQALERISATASNAIPADDLTFVRNAFRKSVRDAQSSQEVLVAQVKFLGKSLESLLKATEALNAKWDNSPQAVPSASDVQGAYSLLQRDIEDVSLANYPGLIDKVK